MHNLHIDKLLVIVIFDNILVNMEKQMSLTQSIETLARVNVEPAQYAAFFGAILIFGGLETIIARGVRPPRRRRRWGSNVSLTVLNIVLLGAIPLSALGAADWAARHDFGVLNQAIVPVSAALVLGFLIRSLLSYFVHMGFHKVPLLWRFHRIHHSDEEMDISTTLRMHPVEFLITAPIVAAGIVLLGIPPLAVIAFEIVDAAMAPWTHANIALPRRWERRLQIVFVTPDMHRIHHSTWQPETDSNYGATLSLWDRAFGTYRIKSPEALAHLDLGLKDCQGRPTQSLLWLLALPFRTLENLSVISDESVVNGEATQTQVE